MPETIPTTNVPFIDLPARVEVHTSPTLFVPEWTEQPFLYCDVLDCQTGPAIDQAQFSYRYGEVIQLGEAAFAECRQLDLIGQFVRVVIYDQDEGEVRRWYGIIEAEQNEVHGRSVGAQLSSGTQRFQAWGLMRLLERVYFLSTTAFADLEETNRVTIARGIPFNLSDYSELFETGNRSVSLSDGIFLFADAPQLRLEWNAYQAIEYLFGQFKVLPQDSHGVNLCNWALAGDPAILEWFVIHTRTDGRSFKDIIDELIPRKRAVGYWVDYVEETNTVYLNLFSQNGSDLILPTGTIPANEDQRELDFELAVSLSKCVLRNVITTTYNEVVAQGQFRTGTGTLSFNSQYAEFDAGWSDDEATQFLEAGSGYTDYNTLEPAAQGRLNENVRRSDFVHNVFRRFTIAEDWNGRVRCLFNNNDPRSYWLAPQLDAEGVPLNDGLYDEGANPEGEPLWIKGLRLLPLLPLRQSLDYSADRIRLGYFSEADDAGTETIAQNANYYLRPLFFYRSVGSGRYEPLEALSLASAFESEERFWSVEPRLLAAGPSVDLNVVGGSQQFIAAPMWIGAATTDPRHDPAKNNGIDYREIYATVAVELPVRAEAVVQISTPRTGQQFRTLFIDVADARLDYVAPYCVVGLDGDGVIQTTSGGFVRDDRERLQLIAKSAAEWYGKLRQTLEVAFRKISPVVELGSLITTIPSDYQREDVNTVVTRLTYHLGSDPKNAWTEFETSFAEFELI